MEFSGGNAHLPYKTNETDSEVQVLAELLAVPGAQDLVNRKDHVGCTPLHKAAYSGARESLALLLQHGGDLAACTNSNTSVLDAIFTYIARPSYFLAMVLDTGVKTNNLPVLDRSFKVRSITIITSAMHGVYPM